MKTIWIVFLTVIIIAGIGVADMYGNPNLPQMKKPDSGGSGSAIGNVTLQDAYDNQEVEDGIKKLDISSHHFQIYQGTRSLAFEIDLREVGGSFAIRDTTGEETYFSLENYWGVDFAKSVTWLPMSDRKYDLGAVEFGPPPSPDYRWRDIYLWRNLSDGTNSLTVANAKTAYDAVSGTSFGITPSSAPTTDYQFANKKYVDDNAGGIDTSDFSEDNLVLHQPLVAQYESHFNTQQGSNVDVSVFRDRSPKENHGTNDGAVLGDGKFSSAYSFDGDNDYIDCGDSTTMQISDDMISVCAWVYPTATGALRHFVSRGASSTIADREYGLRQSAADKFQFLVYEGSTAYTETSAADITTNTWTHVCGVWDGSYLRLFINGVEEDSPTAFSGTPNTPASAELNIGRLAGSNSEFFEGNINDVRIYSGRALTEEEVKKIMRIRSF